MITKRILKKYAYFGLAVIAVFFLSCRSTNKDSTMTTQQNTPESDPETKNLQNEQGEFEKATFAAGCFWYVEHAFANVPGVNSTTVGYIGGKTDSPTYQQVCSHTTGHAEAVEVEFDPNELSYKQLLGTFWSIHDPTQLNRQGPDIGDQYRSAIFFHNQQQENQAKLSKQTLESSGRFVKPIVTDIVPAEKFYPAEEYHQDYFEKHGKTFNF